MIRSWSDAMLDYGSLAAGPLFCAIVAFIHSLILLHYCVRILIHKHKMTRYREAFQFFDVAVVDQLDKAKPCFCVLREETEVSLVPFSTRSSHVLLL